MDELEQHEEKMKMYQQELSPACRTGDKKRNTKCRKSKRLAMMWQVVYEAKGKEDE